MDPNEQQSFDAEHAAVRRRLFDGVRELATIGAMSVQPVDLRFVLECQAAIIDALQEALIGAGVLDRDKLEKLGLTVLRQRTDQLVQRHDAAVLSLRRRELPLSGGQ